MAKPYQVYVTVEAQAETTTGWRAGVAPEFAAALRVEKDPLAKIEELLAALRGVLLAAAGVGES